MFSAKHDPEPRATIRLSFLLTHEHATELDREAWRLREREGRGPSRETLARALILEALQARAERRLAR